MTLSPTTTQLPWAREAHPLMFGRILDEPEYSFPMGSGAVFVPIRSATSCPCYDSACFSRLPAEK